MVERNRNRSSVVVNPMRHLDEHERAVEARLTTEDPYVSHEAIARRAFEISLTSGADPEENWVEAAAQLRAEVDAQCELEIPLRVLHSTDSSSETGGKRWQS